jgi:hypothetical protein
MATNAAGEADRADQGEGGKWIIRSAPRQLPLPERVDSSGRRSGGRIRTRPTSTVHPVDGGWTLGPQRRHHVGGVITQIEVQGSSPLYQWGMSDEYVIESPGPRLYLTPSR